MTKDEVEYRESARPVYEGQWVLAPWSRNFATITEARKYLEDLLHSDWVEEEFPDAVQEILVHRGRSAKWGGWAGRDNWLGYIHLVNLNQVTALHELAHVIDNWNDDHGPVFRSIFLKLVRHEMGFHAYGALKSAMQKILEVQ